MPLTPSNRGSISAVGRALDCRARGRGFDSRSQTNIQGLKITEKLHCKRLDLRVALLTT